MLNSSETINWDKLWWHNNQYLPKRYQRALLSRAHPSLYWLSVLIYFMNIQIDFTEIDIFIIFTLYVHLNRADMRQKYQGYLFFLKGPVSKSKGFFFKKKLKFWNFPSTKFSMQPYFNPRVDVFIQSTILLASSLVPWVAANK